MPSKQTIACLTPERLAELAQQPNHVVYTPTHDIQFEPWTAARVTECAKRLVALTHTGATPDEIRSRDGEMAEFASKYTVFFAKLTDPAFAVDESLVQTVMQLIALKSLLDSGAISETEAQGRSADLALQNLHARVQRQGAPADAPVEDITAND